MCHTMFASVSLFRFVLGGRFYLIVDIKQHHVVSSRHHKVHPGIVSVHHLVFGSVKDGVVHRQHGSYRQHFIGTLVSGWKGEKGTFTLTLTGSMLTGFQVKFKYMSFKYMNCFYLCFSPWAPFGFWKIKLKFWWTISQKYNVMVGHNLVATRLKKRYAL